MGYILLRISANILRAYAVYIFMEFISISKTQKKLFKFLVYAISVLIISGGYSIYFNLEINIISNLISLFLIGSIYSGTMLKRVFTIISIYSINIVVESLVFLNIYRDCEFNSLVKSLNECITSMGIFALIIILKKTITIKNKDIQFCFSLWLGLITIPMFSIIIIIMLLDKYVSNIKNIGIQLSILIINMAIIYIYGMIQNQYEQKIEKEEFYNRLKIYSKQLDVQKVSNQMINQLRHDMKFHLRELQYLAIQDQKVKLLEYIEEMKKHMTNTDEFVASGNKDIDGTLNSLLQKAKQNLHDVELSVSIPENLEIHNYLFNVVFGNLLENAIEAALNTETKYLKVNIRVKQSILYIKIENSYSGEVTIKNKKFLTSKRETEEHGIGLESVKRMVNEMNGMLEIKENNNIFIVRIMFYLNNL